MNFLGDFACSIPAHINQQSQFKSSINFNTDLSQSYHKKSLSILLFKHSFSFNLSQSTVRYCFYQNCYQNFPSVKNHKFIAKKCFADSEPSFNKISDKRENPFGIHLKDWTTLIFLGDYLLGRVVAGRVKASLKPQTLDSSIVWRKKCFSIKTDFGQNSK